MSKTFKNTLIMFFFLSSLLPMLDISADTGPKPSMDFEFKQEFTGQRVTITSGILFECDLSDCQDAQPVQQLGPQGFSCGIDSCSALAYGFSPYHRLEVQFSDGKTRKSNIFKTVQFQSLYEVTIRQTDLQVKSKFNLNLYSPLTYVLLCGGCLIGIVVIIMVIVLLIRHFSRKK